MTTADIITTLRRRWLDSGLTLAEIGQRMPGWHSQNVTRVLSGKSGMTLDTLVRLADALGYDVTLTDQPRRKG